MSSHGLRVAGSVIGKAGLLLIGLMTVLAIPTHAAAAQPERLRDRDAHIAAQLRSALAANPSRRVIVLTGNYHARIGRGAPWNAQQEFMGWHLRDLAPLAINVEAPLGSSWICTPGCGIHSFGKGKSPAAVRLDVTTAPDNNGYMGSLTLPLFTASPPAIRASDSP